MAQPGNFTPILLYGSSTPGNVPLAANLTNSATGSEIAVNVADKNLFFKDSGGTVNTVPIRQSSTSSNGWLSSTDWNTFNNKSNTNGTVTSVAALTLGTTGTDLSSTVANGTTTPVITLNVPTASATNRGALSAADWSTFNGKQAALVSGSNIKTVGGVSLLGSGDVGTIGIGYGGTGQTSFTAGQIHYGSFSTSANLFWDSANNRLGINTNSPSRTFTVIGGNAGQMLLDNTGQQYTQFVFQANGTANSGADFLLDATASVFNIRALAVAPIAFSTSTSAGSPNERMRIHSSGGVSIGNTTDPGATNLSVQGALRVGTASSLGYSEKLTVSGVIATASSQFNIITASALTDFEWVLRTGSRQLFYVTNATIVANLSAAGVWTNASDARYKENIINSKYGLDTVMALKPRSYNLIGQEDNPQVGFIAQEVLDVVPEVVESVENKISKEERYTLSYGNLVAVLTKAIQEQQALIDSLTTRLTALEAK